MRLKKLSACFGRLEHETLELGDGLNLIEAPNEGGKSTWSAFLRAMLYGINTKERDKQGYIAEKNRYLPWSGAAMEGTMELDWQGKSIILRRSQKGSNPFGKFEAVYADTGEPVPGLTGENVGETLLGVPREVFERSAFVGQGCAAVDGAPALEKRVTALVSSGEEEVSYSQVDRRLRDWFNRRQHNKTGLIPKLEHELAVLDDALARQAKARRLAEDARREMELLDGERVLLETENAVHRYTFTEERRKNYEQALAAQEDAQAEVDALRAGLNKDGAPPDRETLRKAQEDLNHLNTLGANIKQAEEEQAAATQAAQVNRQAAYDPLFPDLPPDIAWQQAADDAKQVAALLNASGHASRGVWIGVGAGILLGAVCAGAGFFLKQLSVGLIAGGGALVVSIIASFILTKARGKKLAMQAQLLLEQYASEDTNDMLARAASYRERCLSAEESERQAQALESAFQQMSKQRDDTKEALLRLVHTFAPMVTDTFGVSAAISRALNFIEKLATAEVRLEGARRLAVTMPKPDGESIRPAQSVTPRYPFQETSARLAAVKSELGHLSSTLSMAKGELNSLGDPDLFQSRKDALLEELAQRGRERNALEMALEALGRANNDMQARFSPALNQKAGALMSRLTGGKYHKIILNRDFEATAEERGALLPRRVLALSQGTADQLYLAVRLAICDMALPMPDEAPLILDDALTNFDDPRMALALDCLDELAQTRQILLFTCHSREGAYLADRPGVVRVNLHSR